MGKIKIICPLCGEKSKSKDTLVSCPVCGVSLQNSREKLLKQTDCITSEGAMGVHTKKGVLFLTNHRVFWLKRQGTMRHLGRLFLMDMILDAIFPNPKTMAFSFRLDEITDIEIAKAGPFKQIKMTATGGKAIALDIKAKHRQEWIDAVNEARKSYAAENDKSHI